MKQEEIDILEKNISVDWVEENPIEAYEAIKQLLADSTENNFRKALIELYMKEKEYMQIHKQK